MSTANETITKLSEALNTLIGAYEELQNENKKLATQIKELKADKEQLIKDKENLTSEKEQALKELNELQNDVNVLSDNTEQQNSSMYSMLDKIESLLGNESKTNTLEDKKLSSGEEFIDHTDEVFNGKQELEVESDFNKPEKITTEQQDSTKIDLNRMASLLNGFNK